MKAYIIDITFQEIHPRVWRRVVLPANATFNRLHETIQHVTNFQSILEPYHFFAFAIDGLFITNNEEILTAYKGKSFAGGKVRAANRIKIDTYLEKHRKLVYHYDFGDDWYIDIELKDIVEDYHFGFPTLLEYEGTAPPEDVGGASGYEQFLAIYQNPDHPEHEAIKQWASTMRYIPTNVAAINDSLKYVKYQKTAWEHIHHENHHILSDKYRVPQVSKPSGSEELVSYAIACAHLYGYIEFTDFVRIYNDQNDATLSVSQLESLLQTSDLEKKGICVTADAIMHEVLKQENVTVFKQLTASKPFYVPKKEVLLQYVNDFYYEKTPYQQKLAQMLAQDFYGGSTIMVQQEVDEIVGLLQVFRSDFTQILQQFIYKHRLTSAEKIKQYAQILNYIGSTTRLWEHRGHTTDELFRLQPKEPAVKPIDHRHQIGRNDPCLCGSGKKYKKCCAKA